MAMQAPPEELAYVVLLNPNGNGRPDALAVMDVNPNSLTYQQVVSRVELGAGDEVHHFGWNACSAALCPYAPHPHPRPHNFMRRTTILWSEFGR
jgi:selenium-binding protein 1